MQNTEQQNILNAAKLVCNALDDKMGVDIKLLDIHAISVLGDYFVIAGGNSVNQLQAMADEAEKKMYEAGYKLNHKEGANAANWILLDFGSIIVHLFDKEYRGFYNLERVWADAIEISYK